MAHQYRVHTYTVDAIGDVLNYLKEHGLIKQAVEMRPNSREASVVVVVGNKYNFLRYVNKKEENREPTDPGYNIINLEYLGEVGKTAPSSREGKQMSIRIKRFKEGQKRFRLQ
jgi:hypothetical protein